MQRHLAATLPGCEPPRFPAAIDLLLNVLAMRRNAHANTGWHLRDACKGLAGFDDVRNETTSDGYDWFWFLWFNIGGGRVGIAIPKHRGLNWDRVPAVYVCGHVQDEEVDRVLVGVIDALRP